jgi:hypothetical protein
MHAARQAPGSEQGLAVFQSLAKSAFTSFSAFSLLAASFSKFFSRAAHL